MRKIKVIVNPVSARGTTSKIWPDLKGTLHKKIGSFDVSFTEGIGHGIELARQSLEAGYTWILAVGGDGTLNEVINGFFYKGKNQYPRAAVSAIGTGTGGDFSKTVKSMYGFSSILHRPNERFTDYMIDVGRLSCFEGERYFINMASIGLGGLVVKRINHDKLFKLLGGKIAYYAYTLITLLTFQNKVLRVVLNGKENIDTPIKNIAVANGMFQGGGMLMAPDAKPDDGSLDAIMFGDMNIQEMLLLTGKIYKGEHIHHKKIQCHQIQKLEVKYAGYLPLDVDGENFGSTPVVIECVKKALRLRV